MLTPVTDRARTTWSRMLFRLIAEMTPNKIPKMCIRDRASEQHQLVYNTVRRANEAAIAKIKPGIPLCELDKTARDLITEAGYGPYFTHRLGHFIGLGEHEFGDVSSVNMDKAVPGMIFSIEPGIYLTGDTGVRVEDLVLVTEDGCEAVSYTHLDEKGSHRSSPSFAESFEKRERGSTICLRGLWGYSVLKPDEPVYSLARSGAMAGNPVSYTHLCTLSRFSHIQQPVDF